MATELYAKGTLFVEGIIVMQAVEFSIDFDTNDNPVNTLALGFAGITPGAGTTAVSITSAVPRTGFEISYHKWAKERKAIEVLGYRGASSISVKGFIKTVGEKIGVDGVTGTITIQAGEPEV
jgi:hypothetical protein